MSRFSSNSDRTAQTQETLFISWPFPDIARTLAQSPWCFLQSGLLSGTQKMGQLHCFGSYQCPGHRNHFCISLENWDLELCRSFAIAEIEVISYFFQFCFPNKPRDPRRRCQQLCPSPSVDPRHLLLIVPDKSVLS